jgi:hypothetical protein
MIRRQGYDVRWDDQIEKGRSIGERGVTKRK